MESSKAAVALLLVAVVLLSGCTEGTVSAEQIRDDSLDALEDLESFEFRNQMEMRVQTTGSGLGDGAQEIRSNSSGKVDVEERKIHMTQTQDAGLGSSKTEAYLVNNTMYMKVLETSTTTFEGGGNTGLTDTWIKFELPGEFDRVWESQNYMEQQEQLLNISDVTYSDDGSVDGVEAYVLTVEPDPEEYEELAFKQVYGGADVGGDGLGMEGETESLRDSLEIHNVSVKQWIAKDSHLPLKSSVEFSMTVTRESPFSGETSTTVNGSVVTRFTNHNEEVDIELPEEARDARSLQEILMEAMSELANQTDGGFGGMDRNFSEFRNQSGEISEEEFGEGYSTEGFDP